MEHDGCKGCRYEHYGADTPACTGCKQNSIDKYIRMTNADLIRTMSDEELALAIMCPNETGHAEIECEKNDSCNCRKCCFDWLQSEMQTGESKVDGGWSDIIHKIIE